MTRPQRFLRALAAAAAATVLAAGPVWATETGGESPATTEEAPAGEAPAEEGQEGEGGQDKIQPPLGFDSPQELVGWGFLALTGLAIAVGLANGVKQLKGRRPQADGSWRPR